MRWPRQVAAWSLQWGGHLADVWQEMMFPHVDQQGGWSEIIWDLLGFLPASHNSPGVRLESGVGSQGGWLSEVWLSLTPPPGGAPQLRGC